MTAKVVKILDVGRPQGQKMAILSNESEPNDSIDRYVTRLTCTGEEPFIVAPHWHKNHSEHFKVIEGRVEATFDGKVALVQAGDPQVCIPSRVIHSFKGFKGERLVIEERADPSGIYKALFFNDLFGTGRPLGFWHALRAFYDGDGYVPLPFKLQIIDEVFITVFGGIAKLFVAKRPETLGETGVENK
ncbi:hypothetical protein B0I35DRAFT_414042 [Stachybotrys elegans]|uniref:Cupin type-2 domain-containing protein n=1 Tax=Stachybotrys elegans TaxID=80388 RepID=A0A8K0SFV9_9HYPO|nr:hypothetical protein B0I35DRAFT_414042 [Stachybotrys elegans]